MEVGKHQIKALVKLKSGSILCGGVGTGKSRVALLYYILSCGGSVKINGQGEFSKMTSPLDLYIITTARKRDSLDWDEEYSKFSLASKRNCSINNVLTTVDSWNNIKKYTNVKNAFFIFDEQRLVGSGVWVKSFLKIAKANKWILLTATPGDTWLDYIPVFIANGFYKNRRAFLSEHAVYNRFCKFPKIDKWLNEAKLMKHRQAIITTMRYKKEIEYVYKYITTDYHKESYSMIYKNRWNIYKQKPINNIAEWCYYLRKVCNTDDSKIKKLLEIFGKHKKLIVFYNFNYELEMLKDMCGDLNILYREWNGHKHEEVPDGDTWIYLVQYTAGAEAWNCTSTDTIVFFSLNYSYKIMVQAAGRTDRLNTPFKKLYYYYMVSEASIDVAVSKSLSRKKTFNMKTFK